MVYFKKVREIMLSPSRFFRKIKREKGITNAFKYLVILSVVPAIAITFSAFAIPTESLFSRLGVVALILLYFLSLLGQFISSMIVHAFVYLLKGRGNYGDTFKVIVYGSTPSLLLSWIPFLGFIFGLYSLYLTVKGISIVHSVSILRALAIILLPIILVFGIIAIFLAGTAYLYFTGISSSVVR